MADVLTVDEAADRLRIGRRQCYDLVRQGVIPSLRLGRSIRIPVAQLETMLQGHSNEAGEVGTAGAQLTWGAPPLTSRREDA